ncbi:hypothetical protein D3C72_2095410 [compost metagenome]
MVAPQGQRPLPEGLMSDVPAGRFGHGFPASWIQVPRSRQERLERHPLPQGFQARQDIGQVLKRLRPAAGQNPQHTRFAQP